MDRNIGYEFKRIHVAIEAKVNNDLKEKGLTFSQMGVLRCLFQNSDRVTTQKDIETFLSLKHPTVVGIVRRLEKNGFISVRDNPGPGKSKIVSLTEKGKAFKDSMKENREAWETMMLSGLSDEETETLRTLLERVRRNISEGYCTGKNQGGKSQTDD